MMGGGPQRNKKFAQKLTPQIWDGSTELAVVDDKLGTPTYTRDFACNVHVLLDRRRWGLYNMVDQGYTSRLEVARALVFELGLGDKVSVRPVSSDYFAEAYFAPGPHSERLRNRRLELRNLDAMRPWRAPSGYLRHGCRIPDRQRFGE
jgi:dTDP-4-dehydrorhamnose reductase